MARMLMASPAAPSKVIPTLRRCSPGLVNRNHVVMQRRGSGRCRVWCSSGQISQIERADAYFLTDLRPIILFDGVCNLCNGGVNMVLDNDPNETMRFAALQSKAGQELLQRSGRSPDDISSIVLVEKDRSYIKSEAVLRIANYLQIPFPLISGLLNPFPLFLRDIVYDSVANNRYNIFGLTRECRLTDTSYTKRFIEQ